MTVFPLYCMMWHDRPTSFPPPRQRNINSSDGSTASSLLSGDNADNFLLVAISKESTKVLEEGFSSSSSLAAVPRDSHHADVISVVFARTPD